MQLLGGRAIQSFFVVNPAKGIGKTRHAGAGLHSSLGQPDRLVQIAFAVNGIDPSQIVGGENGVLVFGHSFAEVVRGCVEVLPVHFEHADQGVGSSIVWTTLDDLLVFLNRAILLICVYEQCAQR